jgi:hypothetical protein
MPARAWAQATATPATAGMPAIARRPATVRTSGTKGTPVTKGMPATAGTQATVATRSQVEEPQVKYICIKGLKITAAAVIVPQIEWINCGLEKCFMTMLLNIREWGLGQGKN